jgi:hypothetical protein
MAFTSPLPATARRISNKDATALLCCLYILNIASGCWFIATQTGRGLVFDALTLWHDPSPIYKVIWYARLLNFYVFQLLRGLDISRPPLWLEIAIMLVLVGSSSHSTISCAAV